MQIDKVLSKEDIEKVIERYENHKFKDEIKYFVLEESELSHKYNEKGFFTDKFIVGVHNPHTHVKIEDLKEHLKNNC